MFGGYFAGFGALLVVLSLVVLAIAIMFLVFGIKTTKRAGLPTEEFAKKKGIIFGSAIFETVILALNIFAIFNNFTVETIIPLAVLALIVVFKYVGLALHKKETPTVVEAKNN